MISVGESDIVIKSTTQDAINVIDSESTTVNGKTETIFILDTNISPDAKDSEGEGIEVYTAESPSAVPKWGRRLTPDSYFGMLEDKVAPEIVMWDHDNNEETDMIAKVIGAGEIADPQKYDNDFTVPQNTTGTITIYFTEAIDVSTLTKETFNVPGFTIDAVTASEGTKTVILTVSANADNTSVKTTVTQKSVIYDKSDNELTPDSTSWEVTLNNSPTN